MPINFHNERNQFTYSGRVADQSWEKAMQSIVDSRGRSVIDVGCGGGIYSQGWAELGARSVIGVDSSMVMIEAARHAYGGTSGLKFHIGDAIHTGLESGEADVVFERALIHHIDNLGACLREASRLLRPGGHFIIQDRTPEDVVLPGSREHIRGYLFEAFPKLLDVEVGRRRAANVVVSALDEAGFVRVKTQSLWETRRTYASWNDLSEDLRMRKGRSILHELTDGELESLISFIKEQLDSADMTERVDVANAVGDVEGQAYITEKDKWTIWIAVKP